MYNEKKLKLAIKSSGNDVDELYDFGDFIDPFKRERYKATTAIIGIYFLFENDVIVYIGQSTDVEARIRCHIREGIKVFDSYSFFDCEIELLFIMEKILINKYLPSYNLGKTKKAAL